MQKSAALGCIRPAWRPAFKHIPSFLQMPFLHIGSYFTSPSDVTFNFSTKFHKYFSIVSSKPLGQGAVGSVYAVKWKKKHNSQQPLVVKVIPKTRVIDYTSYRAILTEVECLEKVGGTLNVTHFYGAYEDQRSIYLLLEHCVGGAINPEKLKGDITPYIRDIIHSVYLCHSVNIIHRDLKLDNFLFADKCSGAPVKLCDFGGAAIITERSTSARLKTIIGTPVYTAPEVLRQSYSFPADMWSVGIILYKLLYRQYPFTSDSTLNEQILYSKIETKSNDLLRRLLDRNPDTRITAEQALRHPWLSKENATLPSTSSIANAGSIVQRLQHYRTFNGLQLVIFLALTRILCNTNPIKSHWVKIFKGLNSTSVSDLQNALTSGGYNVTVGEVKMLLSRLDLSNTGSISLNEFCSALIDWKSFQNDDASYNYSLTLSTVFETLDDNNDGLISLDDIESSQLKNDTTNYRYTTHEDVAYIFSMADTDADGYISLEELRRALVITSSNYHIYASRFNQSAIA